MAYDNEGKHDGEGMKMVPESDLIAVKTGRTTDGESHKTAIQTLQTKMDEAGTAATTALETAKTDAVKHQDEASTLRADNAGLVTVKTELETATTSLSEANTKAETAENSLAEANKNLLDARKRILVAAGADETKLAEVSTLEDLVGIEKAANIFGGANNNGDGNKGGGFFGSAGGDGNGDKGDKSSGASKVAAGVKANQHIRQIPSQ